MASVTLQKIRRILSTDGGLALARRGAKHVGGVARAYATLKLNDGAAQRFENVEQLYDYGQRVGGGVIAPFQVRSEILALLQRVQKLAPKVVLEIGTANGGTLFLFARVADPAAQLISVDLPGGEFGEGYPLWKVPLYRSFALPGQTIDLIRGDSHSPQTLERVRECVGGNAVDFLFIDGDHTYEGVKKDYEMYSPLVRSGGMIAFHDIAHHSGGGCEVDRLWNELRGLPGAEDLTENPNQGWAGIGILHV